METKIRFKIKDIAFTLSESQALLLLEKLKTIFPDDQCSLAYNITYPEECLPYTAWEDSYYVLTTNIASFVK